METIDVFRNVQCQNLKCKNVYLISGSTPHVLIICPKCGCTDYEAHKPKPEKK